MAHLKPMQVPYKSFLSYAIQASSKHWKLSALVQVKLGLKSGQNKLVSVFWLRKVWCPACLWAGVRPFHPLKAERRRLTISVGLLVSESVCGVAL